MKTIEELQKLLVDTVESKTGKPFPSEPLFTNTVKGATEVIYKTTIDGISLQESEPSELHQNLLEGWFSMINTIMSVVINIHPNSLVIMGIELSDVESDIDYYQQRINELKEQCLN